MTRNKHSIPVNDGTDTSCKITPVPNATVPYWRSELHYLDEHRSTAELPGECDIAIIGAGMSGVSIAYNLLKLSDNGTTPAITLIEARQVCSGATGRNGGHVKIKVDSLRELVEKFGEEIGDVMAAFHTELIFGLKNVIESERLECEFELRRTFDVYIDDKDAKVAEDFFFKALREGRAWTRERDFVPRSRAEQVTSIKGAKIAISGPACSLWPYKFVTQLLERIVDKINLQTNTPVESVSYDTASGLHHVKTNRGTLKAKKVIFASNGYTAGISPTYKDNIIPIRGTASHLTPLMPVSPHLSHTYNIYYRNPDVDYLNPRPDGGIVVGGGNYRFREKRSLWYNNWDDSQLIPNTASHFDDLMQRNFKGWGDSGSRLESYWTGIMGNTPDGQPHIGRIPGQTEQYVHAGFNGGGMSMIWRCSVGLAKMVKDGIAYKDTGLPHMFDAMAERLKGSQ